jgi:hypothetical protein
MLVVGAEVLGLLEEPKTVSRLWEEFRSSREGRPGFGAVTYDWFVLTLDLLYALDAVELEFGLLRKASG